MHQHTLRHRATRGASLLEAVAFLGIAAFVILGAVSLASKAVDSQQETQMIQDLQVVMVTIRKNMDGNYKGLDHNIVSTLGAMPKNWSGCGSQTDAGGRLSSFCLTPMGRVWIGSHSVMAPDDGFGFTFDQLPAKFCPTLAAFLTNSTQDTTDTPTGVRVSSNFASYGNRYWVFNSGATDYATMLHRPITPAQTLQGLTYDCRGGAAGSSKVILAAKLLG